MQSEAEYLATKLVKYVGWTLHDVVVSEDPEGFADEPNVVLLLRNEKQMVGLHVLRDPEGNGPGWLDAVETQDGD